MKSSEEVEFKKTKKKKTPTRNFKKDGGYIDNIHDLCIHSLPSPGRDYAPKNRNVSARKY